MIVYRIGFTIFSKAVDCTDVIMSVTQLILFALALHVNLIQSDVEKSTFRKNFENEIQQTDN